MANKRTPKKKSRSPQQTQARLLFVQLGQQYADATPAEWDELREHMDAQLTLASAGSPQRREQLVGEFERVRDETLAGQWMRRVRSALNAGKAELLRERGDGLEEWQVVVDDRPARLYVPAASEDAGPQRAREALLGGYCRGCRLWVDVHDDVVDLTHNLLCPAHGVLD